MDFRDRNSQPAAPAAPSGQFSGGATNNNKKAKPSKRVSWTRWGAGGLGLLVVALVVAVIVFVGVGGTKNESQYVDSSKLQAVFLQTGQVYFGNISTLNSKYFVVKNIYYLQTSNSGTSTNATAANTNVSLVKLGCELHAPYDQMVINRDQVTFWENLQSDGQVAKAVATFQQKNPGGQKCADQSSAPNSSSNVQSTTNTTNTNGSTSTTKP